MSFAVNHGRDPQNLVAAKTIHKATPPYGTRCGTWLHQYINDPDGTRTRVAGVKGRSPRPLDDGAG